MFSDKRQATSDKRQATSDKRQATSDKRQATSELSGIATSRRNSQSQQSKSKSQFLKISLLTAMTVSLSACGTITGIPSHGGAKRFAIEQELVSSSARAAVKNMDLSALAGRKVALYVSVIGDQGSGVLTGGRYSIDALFGANIKVCLNQSPTILILNI